MSSTREVLDFFVAVAPHLLGFARDLYELFDGDPQAATAEIEDRRADIARRRARNDEALRRKHSKGEG